MIRKYIAASLSVLLVTLFFSCEKEFENINSEIIKNDQFKTIDTTFIIKAEQLVVDTLRTDNLRTYDAESRQFLLGTYAPKNYKTIDASFIGQLTLSSSKLVTKQGSDDDIKNYASNENIDSTYSLTKAYIRFPFQNNDTVFPLSANTTNKLNVKVYRNTWFLNELNFENPSKNNVYQSNFYDDYVFDEKDNLTLNSVYEYNYKEKDTVLSIPLDKSVVETLFWNKFDAPEFSSAENFSNYFKGVIIKTEPNSDLMLTSKISRLNNPYLELKYAIFSESKSGKKDTVFKTYSFDMKGINLNSYQKNTFKKPNNGQLVLQGANGSQAKLKIFTDAQLKQIRSNNWIINDASLTMTVNSAIDADTTVVPKKLFLQEITENKSLKITPDYYTNLSNAYFDGKLTVKDGKPFQYNFGVTKFINSIIEGEANNDLLLKVYNDSDKLITVNGGFLTTGKTHSWNPKGVTLFNEDKLTPQKNIVLKISYSKK